MKNFLAVFIGSKDGKKAMEWSALDEKARKAREQEGMQQWHSWVKNNQKSIVVPGSPVGKTTMIGPSGISDTKNLLCAYLVVQAESREDAAKLFLNHPHFAIFPGESIELMECLPVPGM